MAITWVVLRASSLGTVSFVEISLIHAREPLIVGNGSATVTHISPNVNKKVVATVFEEANETSSEYINPSNLVQRSHFIGN